MAGRDRGALVRLVRLLFPRWPLRRPRRLLLHPSCLRVSGSGWWIVSLQFSLGAVGEGGIHWGSKGGFGGRSVACCWWGLWGSMEVPGMKNSTPTGRPFGRGSFWGHLKGYVGPMLGRFGSMLGLCWVIWWAMWGSMEVSGMKNSTPTGRPFGWGSFWGHLSLVGGLEHVFFPYIGNNNPNWLSYFSEGWNHQPGILSFPSHLKLYYVNLCKFRVYWDGWNVCTCYFHVISFHMLDL